MNNKIDYEKLKNIIFYILKKCKNQDLTNARLTKIVYLSDWHQALNYDKQISNINWYFDNYGPFVWEIKNTVNGHKSLFIELKGKTPFGSDKTIFKATGELPFIDLNSEEKESIDAAITNTQELSWSQFIEFIYSTYPILVSQRYTNLNLKELAKEYRIKAGW